MENEAVALPKKDEYKLSRIMYILFAAFEYFISISVGGTYIGRIATYIGIPDGVTAIITSILALGSSFQIFALFLAGIHPVKKWATSLQVIAQSLFVFVYFIPVLNGGEQIKTILLFATLIIAHFLMALINAPKTTWHMALINEGSRGDFTAIKEIVSLLSGSLFVYLLGWTLDITNQKTAFIVTGVILVIVAIIETITIVLIKEKPYEENEKTNLIDIIKKLLKNKSFIKVVVVFALWAIVGLGVQSFVGTYQAKELQFTATYSSIIIIISSLSRAVISRPMGKFGDKNSFTKMLIVAFSLALVGYGFLVFTTPSNGKVLYLLYSIFHALGMAGVNSGMTNLTYTVVDSSERTGAFAIIHVLYGVIGFLATLLLTPVLNLIQNNGNKVFGMDMYAQQLFGVISVIVLAFIIIWLILNLKTHHSKELS